MKKRPTQKKETFMNKEIKSLTHEQLSTCDKISQKKTWNLIGIHLRNLDIISSWNWLSISIFDLNWIKHRFDFKIAYRNTLIIYKVNSSLVLPKKENQNKENIKKKSRGLWVEATSRCMDSISILNGLQRQNRVTRQNIDMTGIVSSG